jgi:uncharacterized coiled-coil protein SlyX
MRSPKKIQENLIAERDELKCKLHETLKWKDRNQNKQTEDFNELLCRLDTLTRDYNTSLKELIFCNGEHDCLSSENDELDQKLTDYKKVLEELKCCKLTQIQIADDLQKQYSDTTENRQQLQNKLHVAKANNEVVDKDFSCVQKTLTEQITIQGELEKTISKEQNEKERLVSSINELKINIEKLNKLFQSESLYQQNQENEKKAQLNTIKEKKNNKHEEIKIHECRIIELNTKIKALQENNLKEKSKLNTKVCELKVEINTLTSKLDYCNAKLCDFQSKSIVFKNHLNNQENIIKLLESTKEKIMQELKNLKNCNEKLTMTITTLNQLREKEKKIYETKLLLKNQEKCKIKEVIKGQMDQIKKLQAQILDMKMNKCVNQ